MSEITDFIAKSTQIDMTNDRTMPFTEATYPVVDTNEVTRGLNIEDAEGLTDEVLDREVSMGDPNGWGSVSVTAREVIEDAKQEIAEEKARVEKRKRVYEIGEAKAREDYKEMIDNVTTTFTEVTYPVVDSSEVTRDLSKAYPLAVTTIEHTEVYVDGELVEGCSACGEEH